MSNGRHFTPPTPAYRPRDPFAAFEPRSAERIPSCETTQPLPSRVRPVRVDNSAPASGGHSAGNRSGGAAKMPGAAVTPAPAAAHPAVAKPAATGAGIPSLPHSGVASESGAAAKAIGKLPPAVHPAAAAAA